MTRINLWMPILPLLLFNVGASGASRVERGNLIFDNIPDAPAELADALEGYLSARQATPLGWSPKGQLLISTRFGDVEQLHMVEQAAGERRQLTFLREPITEAEFSPDPARIGFFFLKDVGGNENAQLYYQRLDEPDSKLLTDGKSQNGAALWSNSGREIAFFSTARDGVNDDIDIVEPAAGTLFAPPGRHGRRCRLVSARCGRRGPPQAARPQIVSINEGFCTWSTCVRGQTPGRCRLRGKWRIAAQILP